MKILVFVAFFASALLSFQNKAISQEADSAFVTKNTAFLRDLLSRKDTIDPIQAPQNYMFTPRLQVYAEKGQQLIKTASSFYVNLHSTGFLYQLTKQTDSLLYFKRIDKTYNINYNVDAKWFNYGEELYNLGGYGFWKSNGTLRKYNPKDKEWDVQPLNTEIYTPARSQYVWFDRNATIYIPFQQIINSGLIVNDSKRGSIIKEACSLNLKTNEWTKLGELTPGLSEKIDESPWVIGTKEGYLLVGHEDLYLVNFKKNEVQVLRNSSIAQSFLRINENVLRYQINNKFYTLNTKTGEYDSLILNNKEFKLAPFPIWHHHIDYFRIIGALLLGAFVIGLFVFLFKRKNKAAINYENSRMYKVIFNETETGLIKLIIEKSIANKTATIPEINYILGVKDKNIGMQKKVRSDIINSINEKYRYQSPYSEPLIQSIRSEEDKRYFEYLIKKEMIPEITELIR